MSAIPRGHALIINNQKFTKKDLEYREGNEYNCELVYSLFIQITADRGA